MVSQADLPFQGGLRNGWGVAGLRNGWGIAGSSVTPAKTGVGTTCRSPGRLKTDRAWLR